ncbi:MAG TPA: FN3 associated domain-containing protein, partial [Spirochaetota bacterium]|nr:FN3 associated domain-containing protein [Spirochaetota bacterium]
MKKSLLLIFAGAVVLTGCGSSIKNAQDFIPNKAPVVDTFEITYVGTDSNYDSTRLYSGMPFQITIKASDPEKGKLTYALTSSHPGTFSTWNYTDTGAVCTYYLGSVNPKDTVSLSLSVTDPKNAVTSWTKTVGIGKSGAKLTVKLLSTSVINPSQTAELTFNSDSKGTYRVYQDETVTNANDAVLGSTGLSSYDSVNTDVTVKLLGPSVTGVTGVALKKDVINRVWVVFKDRNDLQTTACCTMYVEGLLPRVVTTSPDSGTTGVNLSPSVAIQFNKTIAASSLVKSGFSYETEAGEAVDYNLTWDDATHTVTMKTVSALPYNTSYKIKVLKNIADEAGNTMLDDYSFSFTTIQEGMLSVPEMSPPAGVYSDAQSVTLSTNDSEASIIYTTDDSNPSVVKNTDGSFTAGTGTVYSGPVSVSKNLKIRALAYKTGKAATNVSAAVYTLKPSAPVFDFTMEKTTGEGNLSISSATSATAVYYTTDGTDPLSSSTVKLLGSGQKAYIYQTMTVRAIAKKDGYDSSDETSKTYYVKTAAPVFVPAGGSTLCTDVDPVTVTLESGALCYYTIAEGSGVPDEPTTSNANVYPSGITLTGTANGIKTYTIKAFATRDGKKASDVVTATFTLDFTSVGTVTFTRHSSGGVLNAEDYEVVTCSDASATVTCTATVGSVDTVYTGTGSVTVPIKKTTILKATANKGKKTAVSIGPVQVTLKVPTPIIARTTSNNQSTYSLSCYDSSAVLYYTTDGSTPTSSSAKYTSAFTVAGGTTVNVIGVRDGWTNSDTANKPCDVYVDFNGNGATSGTAPARIYCEAGDYISIPANTGSLVNNSSYSLMGYNLVFAGWNTESAGSGSKFSSTGFYGEKMYAPLTNITMYAQWGINFWVGDKWNNGGATYYVAGNGGTTPELICRPSTTTKALVLSYDNN